MNANRKPEFKREFMGRPVASVSARNKYQDDPITKLQEECAEIIHILCKVDRFGWFDYHPTDRSRRPNIELVKDKILHVKRRIVELEMHMEYLTGKKVERPSYNGVLRG